MSPHSSFQHSLSRFWLVPITVLVALTAYFYSTRIGDLGTPAARITNMSLSSKLSITDLKLDGERVLIRVDFNVP